MALSPRAAVMLKELAKAGDMVAKALVENTTDILLSAGAEAGNSILVTGQVTDGVGNPKPGVQDVVVTSIPITGTGLLTDGGAGVFKFGSGTKQCWLQTDSTGKFEVAVANAVAEDHLITAQVGSGEVAVLKLTFA